MPIKEPDPIYDGDDYPRDGCFIGIDILATGYNVGMFAPGRGPATGKPIEIYGCKSSEALSQIVECLASGKKVPRDAVNK